MIIKKVKKLWWNYIETGLRYRWIKIDNSEVRGLKRGRIKRNNQRFDCLRPRQEK